MRAVVREFHDIAPEVRHFVFEVPEVERLQFKPGQFVSFKETLKGKQIRSVALLGSDARLTYDLRADGLHIALPAQPKEGYAYAFQIALDGLAR